jgi:MFS superfamily sulfate permease-like transporter
VSGILTIVIRFSGILKYITLIPAAALHGFVIGVGIIIMSNQFLDLVGLHTIKHAP